MKTNTGTNGICCLGGIQIDLIERRSGGLFESNEFRRCAGGSSANVAVGLSRLGHRSDLIACVGNDVMGDFLVWSIEQEALVNTRGLQRTDEASTTLAAISSAPDGSSVARFLRSPGADTKIDPREIPCRLVDSCRVLHIGSMSLSQEPARFATLESLARVKARGGIVSLDVNYRENQWASAEDALNTLNDVIRCTDILKTNEKDARFLTGMSNPYRALCTLGALGPRVVIQTLGARGCLCWVAGRSFHVEGFATRCIDKTGAGDSFMAAFLAGFVENDCSFVGVPEFLRMCSRANAAASVTIAGPGAISSLPHRDELEQRLREFGLPQQAGLSALCPW